MNILKKIGLGIAGLVGALALGAKTSLAAADPSFATLQASSTTFWADNSGSIVQIFLVWIFPILVIAIIFALVLRAKRMTVGVVGGKGGRKR